MTTPEHVKTMISRYIKGEGTTTIGMSYGVSPAAVAYHLKRNGITLRKVGRPHGNRNKR